MEEYRVIRSARKTLSLEITEDLTVLVRAPYQVSQSRIDAFVERQQDWITPTGSAAVSGRSSTRSRRRRNDWTARPSQGDLTPKGGVLWPPDGSHAHRPDHHRRPEAGSAAAAAKTASPSPGGSCATRMRPSTMWSFTSWLTSATKPRRSLLPAHRLGAAGL